MIIGLRWLKPPERINSATSSRFDGTNKNDETILLASVIKHYIKIVFIGGPIFFVATLIFVMFQ